MSVPTDFLRLYQELGIAPGASVEEIKRAYRRRVSELHPDRPDKRLGATTEEAAARLQQITAYYNAALQFHRQHGRLPGTVVPPRNAAPGDGVSPASAASPPAGRSRSRLYVIAAIVVAAAIAWFVSSGTPDESAIDAPVAATESTVPANVDSTIPDDDESDVPVEKSPLQRPHELDIGMTSDEVSRFQDAPVTRDDQRWDYGPSWIAFERGKVVDWYSSPLRPLRRATMHPRPRKREREP